MIQFLLPQSFIFGRNNAQNRNDLTGTDMLQSAAALHTDVQYVAIPGIFYIFIELAF